MPKESDALNYPYIRIRDVEWLKRTLLVFPHVVRIAPRRGGPMDEPEIEKFRWMKGSREPLLRDAELSSYRVFDAQFQLMNEIKGRLQSDESFRRRFLQLENLDRYPSAGVWGDRSRGGAFQLHRSKMTGELLQFLLDTGLAWVPAFAHGKAYVEMATGLGQAVMATIAFACADDEGLTLVTEFPEMFRKVISQPKDAIFAACIDGVDRSNRPPSDEIAEFFVYQRCNVENLTPERLHALTKERDAIANFKQALEDIAQSLPDRIENAATRRGRLNDVVNDVFQKWEADRLNMSSFVREIFGDGIIKEPGKFVEKVAESAFAGAAGAGAGAENHNVFIGAATGLAVGVAVHAATSLRKTARTARESPYRYLTLLEKEGVGFTIAQ